MRFGFTEDQRLLQDAVRDFLAGEHTAEHIRKLWDTETGRSPELWSRLAELGLTGLLVPEESGGMGLDEIDLVLLLEETGHAAVAEPVVSTAAVGAPLVRDLDRPEPAREWLGRIAAGDAILAVGHPVNAFVSDAHVADLLLLPSGGEIHSLTRDRVEVIPQPCNDPSRRIFTVDWTPAPATRVAAGAEARALLDAALDRGALACAAQLAGVTRKLVEMAVEYAGQRKQFGVPIGSFQAVKHMLADVQVALEYARPLVWRAAHSVARAGRCRATDVSMAKAAAGAAAARAARAALQVHGALGYTWEQDLHIWMRRAWSLELAWGCTSWHRSRVAAAVLDGAAPAESFGYSPPEVPGEAAAREGDRP